MKTITVGQLRQNPTEMLADVEAGAVYQITKHNREIGRVVPAGTESVLIPSKKSGRSHTSGLSRVELRTAASIDELLDEVKGQW